MSVASYENLKNLIEPEIDEILERVLREEKREVDLRQNNPIHFDFCESVLGRFELDKWMDGWKLQSKTSFIGIYHIMIDIWIKLTILQKNSQLKRLKII